MLIAQFSDLHYATNTLPEVDRCFGYAIERAIQARVDASVISGDATDHALELHAPAVEALACRLQQLAEHCPVVVRNNSRRERVGVRRLQTRADSGMMSGCCSWREQSSG